MNKKVSRLRRAKRVRAHIRELGVPRLTIHRTPRHIYAQIIDATGGSVVAAASSQSKDLRGDLKYSGNSDAAAAVGAALAKKAVTAGITKVAFDRSGFKYHGRVKALADAARENGLQF
jgi:large subunit ribosomal protein L18